MQKEFIKINIMKKKQIEKLNKDRALMYAIILLLFAVAVTLFTSAWVTYIMGVNIKYPIDIYFSYVEMSIGVLIIITGFYFILWRK